MSACRWRWSSAGSAPVLGFDIKPGADRRAAAPAAIARWRSIRPISRQRADISPSPANRRPCRPADIFIVDGADAHRPGQPPRPTALIRASGTGRPGALAGALVIYESTVYPGCTARGLRADPGAPSGLTLQSRLLPSATAPSASIPATGQHRLTTIIKVTSGSTPEARRDRRPRSTATIVTAGTHKAASIEVAEAAKVIENTQRDLNIALMNELSIIFQRLGIDTLDVLAAAGTKWNFLPFRPGLVGGHCIGVDPYYLTHRAQEVGYHPEVILAGRRINDRMGHYVADQVARLMMQPRPAGRRQPDPGHGHHLQGELPGHAQFAGDRPRHATLSRLNAAVDVWDPWVGAGRVRARIRLCLPVPSARRRHLRRDRPRRRPPPVRRGGIAAIRALGRATRCSTMSRASFRRGDRRPALKRDGSAFPA